MGGPFSRLRRGLTRSRRGTVATGVCVGASTRVAAASGSVLFSGWSWLQVGVKGSDL